MFWRWHTADGRVLRVRDMTDQHLDRSAQKIIQYAGRWRVRFVPEILSELKRRGMPVYKELVALAGEFRAGMSRIGVEHRLRSINTLRGRKQLPPLTMAEFDALPDEFPLPSQSATAMLFETPMQAENWSWFYDAREFGLQTTYPCLVIVTNGGYDNERDEDITNYTPLTVRDLTAVLKAVVEAKKKSQEHTCDCGGGCGCK